MRPFMLALVGGVILVGVPARAYVALMAGQAARPLKGNFNNVPVLHSNQPEEVHGPGILVSTTPGSAMAAETNQPLDNATYTFNGDFGLHVHHKYYPEDRSRMGRGTGPRGKLTLATILINPGARPVHIRFQQGAVRNSFEAPYLPNYLMGVKPLGARPWNTGPGDATAVQMLRGKLDHKLSDTITIAPYSRTVLFSTELPARGIANGLLKGRSDGPFQMAVVAAEDPKSDQDIIAEMDSGRLAPGRIYLNRVGQIQNGTVFSRVAGVALGDTYEASLNHDLSQGALHVPLTSTNRHNFGTGEQQVNPLASRMLDSSVNNIGTYGVRFDVTLNLSGAGPHQLVLSHPTPTGGRPFVAFRGSIGISSDEGYQEVHVGMKSGESLSLASLNLKPGQNNPVKVSLVYPADATPGHLLSVVPDQQLARVRERQILIAKAAAESQTSRQRTPPPAPPGLAVTPQAPVAIPAPAPRQPVLAPGWIDTLPPIPPVNSSPLPKSGLGSPSSERMSQALLDRYQQAVDAQQQFMNSLMGR
jgi:hypothetical protein